MRKLTVAAAILALGVAAPAFASSTDGPKPQKTVAAASAANVKGKRLSPAKRKKLHKDLKKAKKQIHRLKHNRRKRGGR